VRAKKVTIAGLFLVLYLAGCAARPLHPGAINAFDSASFDSLTVVKGVIDSTRTDLANNAFPSSIAGSVKTALNALIQSYNIADVAYQAYHTAAIAGTATPEQQADVQTKLNTMNNGVTALTAVKGGQ
jgi:hypothetical protein